MGSMRINKKATRNRESDKDEVITIGIASTITACGSGLPGSDGFTEGAAVLKYSIDLTSIHGPKGGKYDYKMYILHHPDALECSLPLVDLGFELVQRPTPVNVSDIRGEVLRERIVRNGCCGEKELIKLEAYRLVEHPIVIHLDLDVLVMKPMDPAIDLMLYPERAATMNLSSFVMWPENPIPDEISLMFTKDYNVVAPRRRDKPFQGGFFMIKPSLKTYEEFVNIVRGGDYIDTPRAKGWGGKVGPFHGGMTIQGLLPWYFEYLHPGQAVELNRCVYNNMADNPSTEPSVNDVAQGLCRTNQEVRAAFLVLLPFNGHLTIVFSHPCLSNAKIAAFEMSQTLLPSTLPSVSSPGHVHLRQETLLICACVIGSITSGSSIGSS